MEGYIAKETTNIRGLSYYWGLSCVNELNKTRDCVANACIQQSRIRV